MTPDTIFVVTGSGKSGPAAFRDAADAAAFFIRLVTEPADPAGMVRETTKILTNHGGVARNGVFAESVPLG